MGLFYMQFGKPSEKDSEIRGSSQDVKHAGWIELTFLSLGRHTTSHATRGEREAKPEEPQEVDTGTEDMQAFNRIFLACANGASFDKVTIEGVQNDVTFFKAILSKVMISSCSTGGRHSGEKPSITFALNSMKMEFVQSSTSRAAPSPTPVPKTK